MPKIQHRVFGRHEICQGKGGRLIFVGDVHGCVEELRILLDKEKFDKQRDTLVLVGDLVNKGPESGEVIRLARELGALAVRGNHEDELLEAWYCVGRYAHGLQKYGRDTVRQVSAADVQWLQELPLSLSFPWLPLVVVHAGLVPGVPLEQQTFHDLLWLRDLKRKADSSWEGLESPEDGSVAWTSVWEGPEHVIFGHDAKRKLQLSQYATGLDTGCCYGFQLTALIVDPDDLSARSLVHQTATKVHSIPRDRAKKESSECTTRSGSSSGSRTPDSNEERIFEWKVGKE